MGRRILAVLAGLAASVIMVILGDLFHHQFYPPPEGFDPSNAEAIAEFASTLPLEAFMLMLLTWAASVFVAGITKNVEAQKSIFNGLDNLGSSVVFADVRLINIEYAINLPLVFNGKIGIQLDNGHIELK